MKEKEKSPNEHHLMRRKDLGLKDRKNKERKDPCDLRQNQTI